MIKRVREVRLSDQFALLRTLISNFRSNSRGNVVVMTALAVIPIIGAVGCAIDYSNAVMILTKLQAAADAAALATVSFNSPVITTAKNMTSDGDVPGGSAYATSFFTTNLPASYSTVTPTVAVTRTSTTVTAAVSFSTSVSTYFMGVVGYPNVTIANSSTASFTLPTYIDFYLMLDVSGSMSFPSTAAEQARLQAVNPDNYGQYPTGCTFACHFTSSGACGQSNQGPIPAQGHSYGGYRPNPNPGGYCQGFTISRLGTTPASISSGTNGPPSNNGNKVNWTNTPVSSCATAGTTSCIQLRADAVGYAVSALLAQAASTESNTGLSDQFSVGLYPFIVNLDTSYSPMTNNITTGSAINTAATQLATLLDTGQNATLGSGGTHFENALNSMNTLITSIGTGTSSSNALPYVFIITDGSQDYQTQSGGNWSSENWSATSAVPYQNSATVIPPNSVTSTDYCTAMKSRGIIIAILYIPYETIQNANSGFANNEDGYANNNIPNIPPALQTCASPNFFYTASTPTDIQNALLTMFEQAVSTAHITQ